MMHHAQIAQRAFNTSLMVDPTKALAFLSGLGPRITGQEITFAGADLPATDTDQATASLPARASLFGNDLAQRHQRSGTQPFALIDGIAVIEIAGTLVHRGAWIGQSSGLTAQPVRKSPSTPLSPNMPFRQVMFWHLKQTGSSCPALALSEALVSWLCTPI
jgi:hypothetical protein